MSKSLIVETVVNRMHDHVVAYARSDSGISRYLVLFESAAASPRKIKADAVVIKVLVPSNDTCHLTEAVMIRAADHLALGRAPQDVIRTDLGYHRESDGRWVEPRKYLVALHPDGIPEADRLGESR